jgi:hypothetical protein
MRREHGVPPFGKQRAMVVRQFRHVGLFSATSSLVGILRSDQLEIKKPASDTPSVACASVRE